MASYRFTTTLVVLTVIAIAEGMFVSFRTQEELTPVVFLGKISDQIDGSVSQLFDGNFTSAIFNILATEGSTDYKDYFNISSDSSFYLKKRVDRDVMCLKLEHCIMSVQISAGIGTVFEVVDVHVTVEDINDNTPEFAEKNLTLYISEGLPISTRYMLPPANDLDLGINLIQQYTLAPSGSDFELNIQQYLDGSTTLFLVLTTTLDRELRDRYELYVGASDGGTPSFTGTLEVTIEVTDINDNMPIFEVTEYNTTIDGDIGINSVVVEVRAFDSDMGENSRLSYYFIDPVTAVSRRYFGINEETGRIYIKEKLVSPSGPFVMFVDAKDHGLPPMESHVKVTIYVTDRNENGPQIVG